MSELSTKTTREEKDLSRFLNMCQYESEGFNEGVNLIGGIDEAGRGPLAGPVVAACVILPPKIYIPNLNDSKKLSPDSREKLYEIIMQKALSFGIGIIDNIKIDEINILNATKTAMKMALANCQIQPELVLIDAVSLVGIKMPHKPIIKGDTLSISIAAASILAKVTRDKIMVDYDSVYPEYNFKQHKGYGTREHIEAIKKYGLCDIHRRTFTKNFV